MGGVLNARLRSAADFVRQGAVFADIGTDHAHLPIFLLECGRIERAVCSDINEGPLSSAKRNATESGLLDKTEFLLCDGASALCGKGITDYAICGMGGELIRDIITAAPELHREGVNLILQPMTRVSALRSYLYGAGFEIVAEAYSEDAGKYYVCLNAIYTGIAKSITDTEAELGCKNIKIVNKEVQKLYLLTKKRSFQRALNGKKQGGENADLELLMLEEIERMLAKLQE